MVRHASDEIAAVVKIANSPMTARLDYFSEPNISGLGQQRQLIERRVSSAFSLTAVQ
jgi:hypothetical protein